MAYKQTVAIIGATTTLGNTISKKIAAAYRLLLMDHLPQQLLQLQNQLQTINNNVEAEIIECCKDASWEADIIIVATGNTSINDIADKIKEVTTCKTVVHFINDANSQQSLQALLPYAKVATIIIDDIAVDGTFQNAYIQGNDENARKLAQHFISLMGCSQTNKI